MAKKEKIKISFGVFKLEMSEPGMKSIIILVLSLIFFMVLVVLLPKLTLASIALNKLSNGLSALSGIFKK